MAPEVFLGTVEMPDDIRTYIARFLEIRPEDVTSETRIDDMGLPLLRELALHCAELARINFGTERGALALRTDDLTTVRELMIRINQARDFPPAAYHNCMGQLSCYEVVPSIGHLLRGGLSVIDQVTAEQCVRRAAEMQTSSEKSEAVPPAPEKTDLPIFDETPVHV